MRLRVLRSRAAALLAMLAMALQAVWPLLAQAKPGPRMMTVELCTIDGTTHYAQIPLGSDTPAEKRTVGHCALCPTGGERAPALTAVKVAAVFSDTPPAGRPAPCAEAQFESASHSPAQSRAPPRIL